MIYDYSYKDLPWNCDSLRNLPDCDCLRHGDNEVEDSGAAAGSGDDCVPVVRTTSDHVSSRFGDGSRDRLGKGVFVCTSSCYRVVTRASSTCGHGLGRCNNHLLNIVVALRALLVTAAVGDVEELKSGGTRRAFLAESRTSVEAFHGEGSNTVEQGALLVGCSLVVDDLLLDCLSAPACRGRLNTGQGARLFGTCDLLVNGGD